MPAQKLRLERLVGDAKGLVRHLGNRPMYPGGEGDRRYFPGFHVQPAQLAALRKQDRLAIRRPDVAREHTQRLRAGRNLHLDRVHDDALGTRFEIPQPERRTGADTMALERDRPVRDLTREGEPAAVRRHDWRDRAAARETAGGGAAAFASGEVHDITRLQIQAAELLGSTERIVRPRGGVEIQKLPIG